MTKMEDDQSRRHSKQKTPKTEDAQNRRPPKQKTPKTTHILRYMKKIGYMTNHQPILRPFTEAFRLVSSQNDIYLAGQHARRAPQVHS